VSREKKGKTETKKLAWMSKRQWGATRGKTGGDEEKGPKGKPRSGERHDKPGE